VKQTVALLAHLASYTFAARSVPLQVDQRCWLTSREHLPLLTAHSTTSCAGHLCLCLAGCWLPAAGRCLCACYSLLAASGVPATSVFPVLPGVPYTIAWILIPCVPLFVAAGGSAPLAHLMCEHLPLLSSHLAALGAEPHSPSTRTNPLQIVWLAWTSGIFLTLCANVLFCRLISAC
jgi:hypothetical protein